MDVRGYVLVFGAALMGMISSDVLAKDKPLDIKGAVCMAINDLEGDNQTFPRIFEVSVEENENVYEITIDETVSEEDTPGIARSGGGAEVIIIDKKTKKIVKRGVGL